MLIMQKNPHPVLQTLEQSFPIFREANPLAIGTHKAILVRLPNLEDKQVRVALRIHTSSTRYLKAIANGTSRFDLDGNASGEITSEQKELAIETIKARLKQGADRCRAQQDTERQEQAAAQRQAKLEQLAAKFSHR